MQLQSPLPITYVQRPLIGVLLSPLTPMKISSQMSPTKVIPLKILGGTGGTGTAEPAEPERGTRTRNPVPRNRRNRGTGTGGTRNRKFQMRSGTLERGTQNKKSGRNAERMVAERGSIRFRRFHPFRRFRRFRLFNHVRQLNLFIIC